MDEEINIDEINTLIEELSICLAEHEEKINKLTKEEYYSFFVGNEINPISMEDIVLAQFYTNYIDTISILNYDSFVTMQNNTIKLSYYFTYAIRYTRNTKKVDYINTVVTPKHNEYNVEKYNKKEVMLDLANRFKEDVNRYVLSLVTT